jgi:hypothetical protein
VRNSALARRLMPVAEPLARGQALRGSRTGVVSTNFRPRAVRSRRSPARQLAASIIGALVQLCLKRSI